MASPSDADREGVCLDVENVTDGGFAWGEVSIDLSAPLATADVEADALGNVGGSATAILRDQETVEEFIADLEELAEQMGGDDGD